METLPLIEYSPLAVAVISLLILWFVLRTQNKAKNGNGDTKKILELLSKVEGNDLGHLEDRLTLMDTKLDKLIESNNQQNYILQDIKSILQKR